MRWREAVRDMSVVITYNHLYEALDRIKQKIEQDGPYMF